MKILLSNDDGVAAPGLATLYEHLQELGECVVYAPDRNSSGLSGSITLDRPLRVTEHSNGFNSVNGTPADCVHLAVNALLAEEPDVVVSGINDCANLGDDVLYSGTVGAALEGRFLSMPAIAVSLGGKSVEGMRAAARVVHDLLVKMDRLSVPQGTILNVNVPDVPYDDLKGVKVTRLGHRNKPQKPVKVVDPRGKPAYWIAPVGKEQDAGEGTDFHAVTEGYVSVTPLCYDQTRHATLSQIMDWLGE